MKRIRNNNTTPFFGILFILFCLFLNSCQQPTLGCLDVKATNFDVTVSDQCTDNCCSYPFLKLQVDHLWGAEKFSLNKKYAFAGDSIEFLSFQMYLSEFQLTTNTNKIATVIDSVPLFQIKDTINALSNFTLMGKNNGFEFNIGRFDKPDKYSKVKFQVGLNDIVNKTIASKMPSSSPLSIKADSMYLNASNTYIFNKLVIARKNTKDTLQLFITTPSTIDISIVKNLSFTEGFDAAIPLKINYLQFMSGVDLSKPQNDIKAKIVSNTAAAFSVQ
jgi:hypothetical protein